MAKLRRFESKAMLSRSAELKQSTRLADNFVKKGNSFESSVKGISNYQSS